MNYQEINEKMLPQFIHMLSNLKLMLEKAAAHADQKKFDVNTFWTMKLAPDMFPLGKQIQISCDTAKFFAARLSGQQAPKHEDNEQTYAEFMARIDKTISYLKTFKTQDFAQYQEKTMSFPWYPGKHLVANDFIQQYAFPNFYFHTSMAYAILRSSGVELGKSNFLGDINWVQS